MDDYIRPDIPIVPTFPEVPTPAEYSTKPTFKYWCQTVLPIVYDDSLSYYELLGKVVDYLNNVINDVNEVEDNIGKLYNWDIQTLVTLNKYLTDFYNTVSTWFEELNVDDTINAKVESIMDGWVSDPTSDFMTYVKSVTEAQTILETDSWLSQNISQETGYVLDSSLTSAQSAAPAKTVGDYVKYAMQLGGYNNTSIGGTADNRTDLNDIKTEGNYVCSYWGSSSLAGARYVDNKPTNYPQGAGFKLIVLRLIQLNDYRRAIQIMITQGTSASTPKIFIRYFSSTASETTFEDWVEIADMNTVVNITDSLSTNISDLTTRLNNDESDKIMMAKSIAPFAVEGVVNLNNVNKTGMYILGTGRTYQNLPTGINGETFNAEILKVEKNTTATATQFIKQTVYSATGSVNNASNRQSYYRVQTSGSVNPWSDWVREVDWIVAGDMLTYGCIGRGAAYFYNSDSARYDLNNATIEGHYVMSYYAADDTVIPVDNAPPNFRPDVVEVKQLSYTHAEDRNIVQICYQIVGTPSQKIYMRKRNPNHVWLDWFEIGKSVTNNYTYNTYQNTYDITSSPSIITDNLYILTSTNDDTDRTSDILTMLTANGICRLGSGTFVISNLSIPTNCSIIGCGKSTVLKLKSSDNNPALIIGPYNNSSVSNITIKDLLISGSDTTFTVSDTITDRCGIYIYGDYDSTNNVYSNSPTFITLDNLHIRNFTGCGIKCLNIGTGYRTLLCSNTSITRCNVGVNIERQSEYLKFDNMNINLNYYGVINNGGNNTFSNCGIDGNIKGVLMDNSNSQSPNNTHGCFSNCTINHNGQAIAGHAVDNAVEILGCANGYVFNNCCIFYGHIVLNDSKGIMFNNCLFSGKGNTANVDNGSISLTDSTAMFINNYFTTAPTVTKSGGSIVSANNYIKSNGNSVTI